MNEEDGSDCEDERLANNESFLSLIRKNAPLSDIEFEFTKKGISVDYQNVNKETPLHLAVRKTNKSVVEFLLKNGADPNIPNNTSKTAINLIEEKLTKYPDDPELRSIKECLCQQSSRISKRSRDDDFPRITPKISKFYDTSINSALIAIPSTSRQRSRNLKEPLPKRSKFPEVYKASGVKRALHGTIYQSKLLSLFTKRGVTKGYDFLLATEMDAAEKFDDVVFRYEENDRRCYRFLQAKHKLDTNNKITIADLLTSTEGDYSLQKYFLSFCKINKNEIFKDGVLKDFLIITNVGVCIKPCEDAWTHFFFERTIDKNDILYVQNNTVGKLQINTDSSVGSIFRLSVKLAILKAALELHFVKNSSDFDNIREVLEVNLKKGELLKKLSAKKHLERTFLLETADEVCNLLTLGNGNEVVQAANTVRNSKRSKSKDKEDLLNKLLRVLDIAVEDSKILQHIQRILDEINLNFRNLVAKTSVLTTLNEIFDILDTLKKDTKESSKKTVEEIQSSPDLDEAKKKLLEIIDRESAKVEADFIILKLSLSDSFFKNEIEDFVKKFALIVNYPTEDDLGEIIKDELGEEFLLLNADLVSDSFQNKMLDWFKHYKKGYAGFLTSQMGLEYLDSIKKKINTLLTTGLNKAYPEKLKSYKISFKDTTQSFSSLKECLRNISIVESNQMLHIKSKNTILSSIKLLQLLQNLTLENFEKNDSYIFINLETLLLKGVQKLVVNSFSTGVSHNVLIIECPKILQLEHKIEKLFERLSSVFEGNKKIIILAQDEDLLCEKFRSKFWTVYQIHADKSAFIDLEDDSQRHLLTNTRVLLQNSSTKQNDLRLVDFLDKDVAESIIDADILSHLLENSIEETPVAIGNDKAFSNIGYVQDCYVKRKFHLQSINRKILKNLDNSELLFTSGATKDDLVTLGALEETICQALNDRKNNTKIILSTSENPDELFEEICTKYNNKNIHWLQYKFSVLFWAKTKGQTSELLKYIESSVPTTNSALSEDFFIGNPKQKVVVLANDSGMGKSTVLTNMAREIKTNIKTAWIVRINLNDYANVKEQNCLGNINERWENSKILDFLTEMVIPLKFSDDPSVLFQNRLFRTALNKNEKFQIVIFFDGFDEISPSYKQKTFLLLRTLKTTSIAQFWVTTRVHEKQDLELLLETPSHILYPFSDDDQEIFLRKYLVWKLTFQEETLSKESLRLIGDHFEQSIENIKKLSNSTDNMSLERLHNALSSIGDALKRITLENIRDFLKNVAIDREFSLDFSEYVKILLKNWKETITDTGEMFTFTPLHLKMLAEIVFENKFELPANLEMLSLYQKFVHIKFDIYHKEKTASTVGNIGAETKDGFFSDILRKVHQELAVKLFFPEKYTQRSLPQLNTFDDFKKWHGRSKKDPEQELARVGLVCLRNGELKFVHRSFGEYFLSDYLIENLQNREVQKILFGKVFYEDDYVLVRQIFNDQLNQYYRYKSTKLYLHGLLEDQQISQDEYEKKLYEVPGENLVHISEIYFNDDLLNYEVETYFKETPLHIAARENHCGIIRLICEKYEGRKEVMMKIFLKGDRSEETTLHTAVHKGSHKSFDFLWENLIKYTFILEEVMVKKNTNGKTLILTATEKNQHEILKTILDALINDENTFKNIMSSIKEQLKVALHTAVHRGHNESVQVILEAFRNVPDVFEMLLFSVEAGKNLFHWAVLNNNWKASKVILGTINSDNKKGLIFSTDTLGKTPLFLACESENREIIQDVLKSIDKEETIKDLLIISAYPKTGDLETNIRTLINGVIGENGGSHPYLVSIQNKLSLITEITSAFHAAIKEKEFVKVKDIYLENDAFHRHLILARDNSGRNSLELAVETESVELVKYFLEKFSEYKNIFKTLLSYTDETCKALLHKIAFCGKTAIVDVFLTLVNSDVLKEIVLSFDNKKLTPFDLAICCGHHEIFLLFLRNIQEKIPEMLTELILGCDRHGLAPLHLAIFNNRVDIVKDLINFAKTNNREMYRKMLLTTSLKGGTILHPIFAKGHCETLKTLLDAVELEILIDLFLIVDKNKKNALFLAAFSGKIEVLSVFLEWAKDSIEKTYPGFLRTLLGTASDYKQNVLHSASEEAHDETLKLLMDFIKNNIGDEVLHNLMLSLDTNGKTPLIKAIESGQQKTFDVIIKSISQQTLVESLLKSDSEGNAPLHHIFCKGCNETIESLLVWSKSSFNDERIKQAFLLTNNKGQTVLIVAVCCWDSRALQLLLDVLKDDQQILNEVLLKTDFSGCSALHWAAYLDDEDVARVFLNSTKENCTSAVFRKILLMGDNRGRSFLAMAASKGCLETIKVAFQVLLKVHFDTIAHLLTIVDGCKRTVLHWAYWNNHTEIVEFLLKTTNYSSELHENLSSLQLKLDEIKAGKNSLEEAIFKNDANKIDIILGEMNSDNKRELALALFKYEQPLLQFAAINADGDTFEQLIQYIDDDIWVDLILEPNEDGKTAIYWAVLHGKSGVFKALLEKSKKHPRIFKKLLLNADDRGLLLKDIIKEVGVFRKTTKGMLTLDKNRQSFRNYDDMSEVLRNYYYEMAGSLVRSGSGEVDYEFSIEELQLLAEYLKIDCNHPTILSKVLELIENKSGI